MICPGKVASECEFGSTQDGSPVNRRGFRRATESAESEDGDVRTVIFILLAPSWRV